MITRKWFMVVPFPLPANMQTLLNSMPGWGRGPTFANHELLIVTRPDLRDALLSAGAALVPHHSRSANALPAALTSAAGFNAQGATMGDFFTHMLGDESWAE